MTPQDVPLLDQLGAILLGTIFSFVGLVALCVAAIRRRRGFLVLVWFACFIGMYGLRLLAHSAVALSIAPPASWPEGVDAFFTYMLVVPYLLFWVELTVGRLRRFLWWLSAIALGIGVVGLGYFAMTGSHAILNLNNALAILVLIAVGVILAIPKLSGRFVIVQSRILSVCLCAIAVAALYYTSSSFLRFQPSQDTESAAFALWVFTMGYLAGERVFANERRLLSIESELETARQIQFSILPASIPKIAGLRLAAAYQPMSKVAGDFYHFIPFDQQRVGVLVADVSGHGVPAALISSMIKVATQSVIRYAHDPGEVLRRLNRILSPELRGQLISAAYLWIDTESGYTSYSAAGHPPLLHWKSVKGELEPIESNGLLFGVRPEADYPVRTLPLQSSDRLLIYTDGLVEAENLAGESFGERQLERVIGEHRLMLASDMLQQLLFEIQIWHLPNTPQQDDITLIVADIL